MTSKSPETTRPPDKRQRTPWGSLSREQVVAAATRLVTGVGYEQFTIRKLADELDVAPMALYRHVHSKDDLLDEVVDRLLARRWRPRIPKHDWETWTTQAAEKLLQFLVAEPVALQIYLRHPVTSRTAIIRMTTMIDVLKSSGLDEPKAHQAYAAIHTYTVGFAALQTSRNADQLSRPGDQAGLSSQLASYSSIGQFRAGLRYLLIGIQAVG